MIFKKLGYDYTKIDYEIYEECFENIILVYDFDENELYWITIPDDIFDNSELMDTYFGNGEIFIMSFTLEKRKGYKFKFSTNIKYSDIIKDLEDNKISEKIKINFDKEFYLVNKKFYISADNFEKAVKRLMRKLNTFIIYSF